MSLGERTMWRMLKNVLTIMAMTWSGCVLSYWVPGAYMDNVRYTGAATVTGWDVQDIISGVGASSEPIIACGYIDYLSRGVPLPGNLRNEYCSFAVGLRPTGGGRLVNWSTVNPIRIQQHFLYDANVRTVGEYLAYANERGAVPNFFRVNGDNVTINIRQLRDTACLLFYMSDGLTLTTQHEKTCVGAIAPSTVCEIQQPTIDIDHGTVSGASLTNGSVRKDVDFTVTCTEDTSSRFYFNLVGSGFPLNPIDGSGSVNSKLELNGKSLHSGEGVLVPLSQGPSILTLRSTLSGAGTGTFLGMGVLLVSFD